MIPRRPGLFEVVGNIAAADMPMNTAPVDNRIDILLLLNNNCVVKTGGGYEVSHGPLGKR